MEKVKETIKEIQQVLAESSMTDPLEKELFIIDKYPEFAQACPFLVKMLTKPNSNIDILNKMINSIEKVSTGEADMAEEEKKMGETLAEIYVYPYVKKNDNK